jgi:hypothetical protein
MNRFPVALDLNEEEDEGPADVADDASGLLDVLLRDGVRSEGTWSVSASVLASNVSSCREDCRSQQHVSILDGLAS